MNIAIHSLEDLSRQNIETAWSLLADQFSPESFEQLCRVTAQQLHDAAGCPESCHARLGLDGA